jgi:integrase
MTTCYVLNGKRVPKETAGAEKKQVESRKWYGVVTVNGKKVAKPLSRDKRKSEQLLNAWETDLLRGRLGLKDPFEEHKLRAISDHVGDYLRDLVETGSGRKHQKDTNRQLKTLLLRLNLLDTADGTWKGNVTRSKLLTDLNASKVQVVDRLLAEMTGRAGRTKNTYRGTLIRFGNWLVKKKRLPTNPFSDVTRADESLKKRVRRAESEENILKLLAAAQERPLAKLRTIYTGPRQGQLAARVRPQVEARLRRDGLARAILYKAAVLTGLRSDELRDVRVKFVHLDAEPPIIDLPGSVTKNGQPATFLLRADFVDDLREWLRQTCREEEDRLFHVPRNYLRFFKKDLAFAGLKYQDANGRYFDFHALRKCCNVFLGKSGIPPALRQKYMRHSDIRLTLQTYDDAEQYEQAMILAALPNLPIRSQVG